MPRSLRQVLVFVFTVAILALPPLLWLQSGDRQNHGERERVLNQYLKFLYARDFQRAYNFISAEDQRLKSRREYARERGSFSGFTLEAARKLAGLIDSRVVARQPEGNREIVRVALKLPDANALSGLLLYWDERKLNALPASERRKVLATIDELWQQNKLPMIEGEEDFVLVRENSSWKVFLNWAAGVHVNFATTLPPGKALTAQPVTKGTVARSGDSFTIGFKVKNLGSADILTRIIHRVEPKEMGAYLDLVECALLLPVRLRAGEEQIFNSTYLVRGDLPDGAKTIDVTYEFRIEN